MKGLSDIKLREDLSLSDTRESLIDEWQRVPILTSNRVELPEVDIESKASGRLSYK